MDLEVPPRDLPTGLRDPKDILRRKDLPNPREDLGSPKNLNGEK